MAHTAGDKFTVEYDKQTRTGLVYEDDHCIWEGPLQQAEKYAESLNRALWYKNKHSAHTLVGGTGPEATNLGG